jgi:aldehyde dehydrogenase (NAD+)
MACTRILVHSSCLDETLKHLEDQASQIVVGDPYGDQTQVGPLISQPHLEKVLGYLEIARAEGEIVCGGEQIQPDGLPGHFLTPAIVTGLPISSPVVQDDIFGPVLSVETYDDENQAIALANATPYGLAASVWTTSLDTAMAAGRRIEAGTVWINGYNKNTAEMPSGGVKNSGLGRTRGIEGIEEFTVLKNIHLSLPDAS